MTSPEGLPPAAQVLIDRLGLARHPTCGYVAMIYLSEQRIAAGGLPAPFDAGRSLGSALHFLVTDDAPVLLHRIANDQLYHYQLGDPLEVLACYPDGSHSVTIVGPDVVAGQQLHLELPGGTFHTARLYRPGDGLPHGNTGWFLGASTEWPGVEERDVEVGDLQRVAGAFPEARELLAEFIEGR